MRRRVGVWVLAAAVWTADRAIKSAVAAHMVPGQSIGVFPPVLSLTYVLNSGAAFSLFRHDRWIFIAVALGLLGWVLWVTVRSPVLGRWSVGGLGLLAGGAAGNLWDRLVSGRVIDYIQVPFWPVFNLADASIVVGMALIVWEGWQKERVGG